MKLSKEQKSVVKSLSVCMIACIAVNAVLDLIKGRFSWSDTLLFSLFLAIGFSILGVIYILGMKKPQNRRNA